MRLYFIVMITSFLIEPDSKGGFLVRATELDDGFHHIADGFLTRAEAQKWINDRMRVADRVPSPPRDS
jgi:hypothetical protein